MIQPLPYRPGVPRVLPLRSAAVVMPLSALVTTTDGKSA